MADDLKIFLQATLDVQKSQNLFNKQIEELKTESLKIKIEIDNKTSMKVMDDLSKKNRILLLQAKSALNNQISSFMNNNPAFNGELKNKLLEVQKQISSANKIKLSELEKEFKNITSETESLGTTGDTTFFRLGKGLRQFFEFLKSNKIVEVAMEGLKQMITEVSNLDKVLVDLQMFTGSSYSQAKELLSTYIDLGQQLGITATEVSNIASAWFKQGKSIADTNTLIKDSFILSKIGSIESADATNFLTTITKSYGIAAHDTLSVVDKLSKVDLSSVVDVSGLAQAVSEASANAQSVGINIDELLGYAATIGEATDVEMSSVGDSLNTMFSRIANIKLNKLIDPETNEDLDIWGMVA